QDYIADGISENIISALSKISEMFVIASNSTFTYKDKPVKIQQVSEELGVRYVLEGSAQKIGNRVRITAQLIDATTGYHLWSEKYDRDFKDLFALQDEIAHKIIVELQVKLTEGEQARISHKSTTNLEAWSYAVRGLKLFERSSKENNAKAMEFFERAVELDPNYVWAWVRLAWTHIVARRPGWGQSPTESIKMAEEISKKVLSLDESDSDVHALLGLVYLLQRRYEMAIAEGEKSLILGPTNAQAHVLLAVSMYAVGRFDEAIQLVKKAMRLHPYYPAYYLQWLGGAYRMKGRYEEALTVYKQLLDRSQKGEFQSLRAHLFLADVYAEYGSEEEARIHAAKVLEIRPGFSLEAVSKISSYGYKDQAHLERRLNALRKAGIPETPPLPLPAKPSIAVLPFVNMSGDPEQEYFSDGLTEEIITALSKTPKLFVIARNSISTYKGKPVKVQQVGRELGVKFVLEGSVRKSEGKVRITAQLVDAQTGHHLWAERYDRDLKDIFALQDEITMNVIKALELKLTDGEQALVYGRGTNNLEAYLKAMQARGHARRQNPENNLKARRLIEEAIALDPNYSVSYYVLGVTHLMDVWLGTTKSPRDSLRKAAELSLKAIARDESFGPAYALLGNIYILKRDYEKGISEGRKAVELEPNGADSLAWLGMGLFFADRPAEAIQVLKKAIRLNPIAPGWYLHNLAGAYRDLGQYEEAIAWAEKAVERHPKSVISHVVLAACYSYAGRLEDARVEATEVLRLNPNFSVERFAKTSPKKNPIQKKRFSEALLKAGLK
ncbi:MAG: tetratricopeptide repeat protein, partial [Deltaproteobacteria bacterium]|nr:tetratricopeptide repeat protein [Deltaproteobacteria bacterium]